MASGHSCIFNVARRKGDGGLVRDTTCVARNFALAKGLPGNDKRDMSPLQAYIFCDMGPSSGGGGGCVTRNLGTFSDTPPPPPPQL